MRTFTFSSSGGECHNPTLGECGGEAQHSQSWGFGVLRTPECLELDRRAQNTSHWGVLHVIGKVLKCKYRKWPRIGHLDICSPSYGQKKGRESNWQFDSQPQKVGNRPFSRPPNWKCYTSLERSWRGLQVWLRHRRDQTWKSRVMSSQSRGTPPGTISGQFRDSNLGVPGKRAIWM